jgi:hypothetical protein
MALPSLYKYLDIQGARLTLKNRTFRHAKPSMFKDTEELTAAGLFPEDYETALSLIQSSLIDILLKHIDEVPRVNIRLRATVLQIQKVLKADPSAAERLKQLIAAEGLGFTVDWLKNFAANAVADVNAFMQNWRILCVTQAFDSEKMWSEYAGKHQGIVLRIVPCAEKASKFERFLPVSYKENRPSLSKSAATFFEEALFGDRDERSKTTMNEIVYTKTLPWKDENEYRLAIWVGFGDKDWTTLSYHSDEITEMYLGANATDELKAEFVALAKATNSQIKVFDMKHDVEGILKAQGPR